MVPNMQTGAFLAQRLQKHQTPPCDFKRAMHCCLYDAFGMMCRWSTAAQMVFHTSPVLSTCCTGQTNQQHTICSGASDGSVAVWGMSSHELGSISASTAGAGVLPHLQPSWNCLGVHQSGINAISAAYSGNCQEKFLLSWARSAASSLSGLSSA